MEWTADVQIGRSHATIEGTGSVNLLDVVADALGVGAVELANVIVVEPNKFMIGYNLGSARNMIANVTISVRKP